MAIFRRRVVQQALETLSEGVISPEQRHDIVRRLNSNVRQAIAAEWEVVLLAALSSVVEVHYERSFEAVRLDIFAVADSGEDRIEFVADIATASDMDIDKRNPVGFLFEEFHRIAHKFGYGKGGFDIRVGDREVGKYRDKRTELLLPPKGEIPAFLTRELGPFLKIVALDPESPRAWEYRQDGIDIRISYNPKQRGGVTGGYSCAASPMSLRRNPLFAALNAKATQLRRSGYAGVQGIFVTDGDCRSLAVGTGGGLGSCSRDQIVEKFLEEHPRLHFVTTTTYENRSGWGHLERGLSNKVYWQRPFDSVLMAKLNAVLKNMFRALPPVIESPDNAWRQIRSRRAIERGCNLGAYRWTPTQKLSISSRTFAGLLAQTLSQRDFRLLFDPMEPPNGGPIVHFFRNVEQLNTRIANVFVEHCEDDDDDWITFSCNGTMSSPPLVTRNLDSGAVEISMERITRYLATLNYNLIDEGKQYSLGERIPPDVILWLRACMTDGRTLVAAEMQPDYRLRLFFGERDVAVADYM
jgi:hypothetical protein